MSWNCEITDLNSITVAFPTPYDLTLTRRLNSYASCSFRIPALDQSGPELLIAQRAVKLYRNGVLRFYGKIADPLTEDQDWISVVAHDPIYWLSYRRLQADTVFTNIDAGSIASSLVSTQNSRSATHLTAGSIATSVNRDRTYVEGNIVAELIKNLAEVDNGFYYLAQPVNGSAGTFANLEIRYPNPGSSKPSAKFEYGDGTVANLTGFGREQKLPLNRIRATGAVEADIVLESYREDIPSQAKFDIIEDEKDFPTVVLQPTLDQHAQGELKPNPPTAYSMSVLDRDSPSASLGEIFIPSLFDDFDVGDAVSLRIRHGRVDVNTSVRVAEATVSLSNDSGAEKLDSVLVWDPSLG